GPSRSAHAVLNERRGCEMLPFSAVIVAARPRGGRQALGRDEGGPWTNLLPAGSGPNLSGLVRSGLKRGGDAKIVRKWTDNSLQELFARPPNPPPFPGGVDTPCWRAFCCKAVTWRGPSHSTSRETSG